MTETLERNTPGVRPYYEIPGFEELGLEDSWVLDIQEETLGIVFFVDFALCRDHPNFAPPLPNELNSFRRGRIQFKEPSSVTWIRKTMIPNFDATGEADFGNFDSFYFLGNCFHLDGDWGEVEIVSSPPSVNYVEEKGTVHCVPVA